MQFANINSTKVGYSILEACLATSLSKSTLYNHIRAGRLRAVKVGGRTIIPTASLVALISGEAA